MRVLYCIIILMENLANSQAKSFKKIIFFMLINFDWGDIFSYLIKNKKNNYGFLFKCTLRKIFIF